MISQAVTAQQSKQLLVTKYTQDDGLVSYNVRSVIQDKFGFSWIATQEGVSRFDGHTFTSYTKNSPTKEKLCGVDVHAMAEDTASNLLWVLPAEKGLNAINTITGVVTKTVLLPYQNVEEWSMSMILSGKKLWIGSYNGVFIYDIAKETVSKIPMSVLSSHEANVQYQARLMTKDSYGNIWVCFNGYGIAVFNPTTKELIRHIPREVLGDHLANGNLKFTSYVADDVNAFLFSTNHGLRKISYDRHYTVTIDTTPSIATPDLNHEPIEQVQSIKDKELLVASHGHLYQMNNTLTTCSEWKEMNNVGGSDWLKSVQCIYADTSANVWLGCAQGLAFISGRESPFHSYYFDKTTNLMLEHIRSIGAQKNGLLLAGLSNGLMEVNQTSGYLRQIDSLHLYHHLFSLPDGNMLTCRADGLFVLTGNRLISAKQLYPELGMYSAYSYSSHLNYNDSLLLLGTENSNGVLVWNHKRRTVRLINDQTPHCPLGSNIVNNLYKDGKGNVWVLSDNVVTRLYNNLQHSSIMNIGKGNKRFDLFFDMCELGGDCWLTSYGNGIIRLDSAGRFKELISLQNGLSNSGVYNIFNNGDSLIIITTNNGLSVYNPYSRRFRNFYKADGLHSSAFEEVAALSAAGRIYAGGINGFTIIDPRYFSINRIPPLLYFSNVQIKTNGKPIDTANLFISKLEIPNNWLQVSIFFSGISPSNPKSITYQYRIKEQGDGWLALGSQNFITLIGLAPGTYTLQIKAANEAGIESGIKELQLIFLPHWYETIWLKIAVILALATIFYALYRYRLSQLKAREAIRRKIASDLHDDLGSTLTSIRIFTDLAIRQNPKDFLQQIKQGIQDAMTATRDMIWVMDRTRNNAAQLLEKISSFAVPLTKPNEIHFELLAVQGLEQVLLKADEQRDLYLITKEFIANSLKYAGCKTITLEVEKKHKRVAIRLSDDGKGFDVTAVTRGKGLDNMLARAKAIRYTVLLDATESGTVLQLTPQPRFLWWIAF